MTNRYTAVITREDTWFIARCLELPVTSQGQTLDDARANLQEAVELYIESFGAEDLPISTAEVMIYPFEVQRSA
jgi:predicted RNase H-like HicB family nuclease